MIIEMTEGGGVMSRPQVEWDSADGTLSVTGGGVLAENVRKMTHVKHVLHERGIVTGRWKVNPRDTDGSIADVHNKTRAELEALCQ